MATERERLEMLHRLLAMVRAEAEALHAIHTTLLTCRPYREDDPSTWPSVQAMLLRPPPPLPQLPPLPGGQE